MSLETTETHARADQPRLLPALLEDRIVKWIGRSGGVVLLVVLALLWLCLLTWSVTDPSLTFATAGRAQNASAHSAPSSRTCCCRCSGSPPSLRC